jgi:hypothetical protein
MTPANAIDPAKAQRFVERLGIANSAFARLRAM